MLKARIFGLLAVAFLFLALIPTGQAFAATQQKAISHDDAPYFNLGTPLNFSSASGTGNANGAQITLDPGVVQQTINDTFQHTLFAQNANGGITVYSQGNSPVNAQVTQNSDGSVGIAYTISTNTASISFNGTLANGQMNANYQQNLLGGATADHQQFMGGTNISASFTAQANAVTADQVPGAPSSGQFQFSSDGGVNLSWQAASGNVSGYVVYRLVMGIDHTPQELQTTTGTSYSDESSEAIQNAQTVTGILYTIYAVGPTGITNPTDAEIYVSGGI